MEIDKKRLKNLFPHLAEEMDQGQEAISIDSYGRDAVEANDDGTRRFTGYEPTVIDFIRRCDGEEQAKEIIDFMEKRNEISREYAESLREKIRKEGLRSLGQKKKPGFYEQDSSRP
jgi:hypothetical protein